MLALRSTLVIDALDEAALAAAVHSAADAVAIDLASPAVHGDRPRGRALAAKHLRAIAASGRPVHVRVSDTRSGELEGDLDAVAGPQLAAVILSGTELPQDVRDVDVALRAREQRLGIEPGGIRLVPEIDSAEALLALPRLLEAVDRHGAVMLSVDGLRDDLRLGDRATALYDHAMADMAMAARAARLPWLLAAAHHRPQTASLPTRAHDYGASGVVVREESAARGMNALFTPDAAEVAIARAMLAEWERVRRGGRWLGVVAGEMPEAARYDRLVDRRTVRRARALVALAEAIAAREQVR